VDDRPWNKGAKKAFPNMGVDFVCYSVAGLEEGGDGERPVDAIVAPQSAAAAAADDRPFACVVQEVRLVLVCVCVCVCVVSEDSAFVLLPRVSIPCEFV